MTWVEAARGPFERLLEAEREAGSTAVRARLEGFRLAYLDLRAAGEDRPLAESPDAAATRGTWVLWMLRARLSPLAFEAVRAAWAQERALDTAGLRECAERAAGANLGEFFDFWVFGTALPDYRLLRAEATASRGAYPLTARVENRGTGAFPAALVVRTEEGARHEWLVCAAPGGRAELRVTLPTRPVVACVDPDSELLMATGERPWVSVQLRRLWMVGR